MMTRSSASPTQVVFRAMIVGTVAVAAFMFVLSFVGLRDYGVRLMRLDVFLAPLVPLGVDVFSVVGIAATYLLRRAPWHVRLYAWTVFLVPAALSVAGNLAHGEARGLVKAGLVGAALPPVLLALSVHLVVVTRRALDRNAALVVTEPLSPEPESAPVDTSVPLSQPLTPEPVPGRPHNAVPDDQKAWALRLVFEGRTFAEAAGEIGVAERTIRRWFDAAVADVKARPKRSPRTPRETGSDAPVSGVPDIWTEEDDHAVDEAAKQTTPPHEETPR